MVQTTNLDKEPNLCDRCKGPQVYRCKAAMGAPLFLCADCFTTIDKDFYECQLLIYPSEEAQDDKL